MFNDEQLWDMQDDVETAKSQKESKAADDVQPMEGKAWWMMDTVLCLRDLLNKIESKTSIPCALTLTCCALAITGRCWRLRMSYLRNIN